jgi:hypothetical protein
MIREVDTERIELLSIQISSVEESAVVSLQVDLLQATLG